MLRAIFFLLSFMCAGVISLGADISSHSLPRSSPEKQGISSSAILSLPEYAAFSDMGLDR